MVAWAAMAVTPCAQQRTLLPITSSSQDHRDAILSPDGLFVAFRGPNKLAVVPYAGGSEIDVEQGNNLGSFLWAPDSLGLFYLNGLDLKYVARGGGNPRLVASLVETGLALWDVKSDGSDLFGTWTYIRNNGGQPIRETHIFAIAADGSAPPRTLVTSVVTIDGVQLSPDETRMVYREYDPTPFTPRDYVVANVDGSSPVSLTGSVGLNINPGLPAWRPDGTGIYFARVDRNLGRLVIEQLLLGNPTPIPLTYPTAARNFSVGTAGRWVVYEGFWSPTQSWTLVLMPTDGGGHVFLDPSRPLSFTGTPQLGGVAGDRVVVSGVLATAQFAQVHKVELARELRIAPRATLGGQVGVELPVVANEAGVVMIAAARLPTPFTVPGLAGGFQLDPTTFATVVAGTGSGQGPIVATLPIPGVAFLRHRAVYLQGLRLTSTIPTGDFTRLVELPLF